MHRLARWIATCVGVIAFAGFGAPARAVLLSDLIADPNNSIVNGDKRFDHFTFSSGGTATLVPANAISVNPIMVAGNLGIQFQAGFNALPGTFADYLISYVVTVTNNTLKISDAHMDGNPAVLGGTGITSVTETFTPDAPDSMSIFHSPPAPPVNSAMVVFGVPHQQLHVRKDILLVGGTGVATLSFIDQTFSQTPEPASMTLVGLGAIGLVGYARRKKAQALKA